MENDLLLNLDKIHTTELGVKRISKNLDINSNEVINYCKKIITNKSCLIYRQGKNWYCALENVKITINSYSYTIITAHLIR